MSRRFMLDTDTCSFAIRGGSARLKEALSRNAGALCVSAITAAELRYGAKKNGSKRLSDSVSFLLSLLPSIPWDDSAAEKYAEVRIELETAGTPIGNADMMIAASALSAGCAVVTHNTDHFSRVRGLSVEDWA